MRAKKHLNLILISILITPEIYYIKQNTERERIHFRITHNMVVHFPIAFVVGSGIFEFLSFFRDSYINPAKIMIGLASFSSFLSFVTGQKAEENIMKTERGKEKKSFVEIHGALGITLFFTSGLAFLFKFFPQTKIFSSVLVFTSTVLALLCGYFGGIISHK